MVRIEEVLQVAMDSRASDIHLTAGLPPKMRVNGHLLNMDFPVLKPEDTLDIVGQIMTEHQKQMFEERGELDMSFAVTNLGRYRVNAFRQRGSVAMALRAVNTVIPTPAQLGVPNAVVDLYNRKRGLVLVTGPTGSGKSTTLASMVDYINRTTQFVEYALRYGRPVLCSEWMARTRGSDYPSILPLFKEKKIGSFSYGLVNGKQQCQYPWNSVVDGKPVPFTEEPELWFHDLCRPDHTPYNEEEIRFIKDYLGRMKK